MKYQILPTTAICLCLDKRKEHWPALQKQVEDLGMEFIPYVCGNGEDSDLKYDQIDDKNPDVRGWGYSKEGHQINHWNALKGHKGITQKAKDLDLKSFLLLEDDALILNRAVNILERMNGDIWEIYLGGYDLVYLGWWRGNELDDFNTTIEDNYKNLDYIFSLPIDPNTPVAGLHGCIIRNTIYDFILNCPMNNPLDSQFVKNRENIPSLMICPKIIHTKDMWSHTEGCLLQRKKLEE